MAKSQVFVSGIYVFRMLKSSILQHLTVFFGGAVDPELEAAFLIADALRQFKQAGFTVMPNYSFADRPFMDGVAIGRAVSR
jgi:hypothetical protein